MLRWNMAFGRATFIIKTSIQVASYKTSGKYNERHNNKRLDIGSSIDHNRNFVDDFVHHIISTCVNYIREIKKRLVGYTEIDIKDK